ncbi:response regulator, partial [Flavobacterium sp.]|uniref:response regulator n=1 Tax=Flavobacterium sp. TaxID=239 RepID=UPI003752B691
LAIEKLKNNPYDIVLMDLQMPVMNGFQTTDYIRNTLKSDISIIALTADVTTVDLLKCIALGMNDYISKPVDEKKLYNKIVSLIKNPNQKIKYDFQEKSEQQVLKHIDIDAVNKISNSNPKLTSDMINIYLKQTPTLVIAMKESLEKKDWSLLKAAVHKMIPSFSIMIKKEEAESIAKKIQDKNEPIDFNGELNNLVLKLGSICTLACNEIEVKLKK